MQQVQDTAAGTGLKSIDDEQITNATMSVTGFVQQNDLADIHRKRQQQLEKVSCYTGFLTFLNHFFFCYFFATLTGLLNLYTPIYTFPDSKTVELLSLIV